MDNPHNIIFAISCFCKTFFIHIFFFRHVFAPGCCTGCTEEEPRANLVGFHLVKLNEELNDARPDGTLGEIMWQCTLLTCRHAHLPVARGDDAIHRLLHHRQQRAAWLGKERQLDRERYLGWGRRQSRCCGQGQGRWASQVAARGGTTRQDRERRLGGRGAVAQQGEVARLGKMAVAVVAGWRTGCRQRGWRGKAGIGGMAWWGEAVLLGLERRCRIWWEAAPAWSPLLSPLLYSRSVSS